SFLDWLYTDMWDILIRRLERDTRGNLKSAIKNLQLSVSILDILSPESVIKRVEQVPSVKQKQLNAIKDSFYVLSEIDDASITQKKKKEIFIKNSKMTSSILTELRDNKLKEFYLIENWDTENNKYNVILTREIGSISSETCKKISKGCWGYNLTDKEIADNSF